VAIAPSLLASDFAHLADEIARVTEAGADLLHLDVMDGHFVPNLTIGPAVVERIRAVTDLYLDVHLMITDPGKFVDAFAKAGADNMTFHAEVVQDTAQFASRIHDLGCNAGISLNPDAPTDIIRPALGEVDMVLVMTVFAGFGGQEFIADMLPRLREVRRWLAARTAKRIGKGRQRLEVDGGINPQTAARVAQAGADVIVAGTAVFGEQDYAEAIRRLRAAAEGSG